MTQKLKEVFEATRRRNEEFCNFLASVSEEQALFRPEAEQWSIGELAHHVSLAQDRILRAMVSALARAEKVGLFPIPTRPPRFAA